MKKHMMTYRKMVMPEDENPAKRLFGGRLMQWSDEAAVLFAICQMRTNSVVTLKVSEVLFKNSAKSGDILEFWTRNKKIGKTSLTVECVVTRKQIGLPLITPAAPDLEEGSEVSDPSSVILSCEFVFVAIDESGKPVKHALALV